METKAVCLCVVGLVASLAPVKAFDFEQVREEARALSKEPFRPSATQAPESLLKLTYEQYQSIRFQPGEALWADAPSPFQVEFFLPGFLHKHTVAIHEVSSQNVRRIPFAPEAFQFGTNGPALPKDLDYAGLRIIYGRPGREVAVFLDATYFRMVGLKSVFGTSARGLALNTSPPDHEEFPAFREFWLRKPEKQDQTLVLWALLDSPSVAGAYEFAITPGPATVSRVRASLFPRKEVRQFGIAPLTSMFLYDRNSHPPYADFRPEVHDCDGLLMHTGQDEWIWRPLDSRKMIRLNSYLDTSPKGFGLIQRGRAFTAYEDLVARFDLRPNVWVEPTGNWGEGHVELVQLPSDIEFLDNVVAFWVPKNPPHPGKELTVSYQLHWLTNTISTPGLGYVRSTLIGQVSTKVSGKPPRVRFVVEFSRPGKLDATNQIGAEVSCGPEAKLLTRDIIPNQLDGTLRLVLEISEPAKAVDLRACLTERHRPITETWSYTWQP